jgi:hypothetical protein
MLGDAVDQLDQALDELYSGIDARDLEGVSALRPRLTQIWVKLKTAQQALASPLVLGLQAERHSGDVITHK